MHENETEPTAITQQLLAGAPSKRTVMVPGVFDLFHYGHTNLLRTARALAGENGNVVVALASDDHAVTIGKPQPILTYGEREIVLRRCCYVDAVGRTSPTRPVRTLLKSVHTDVILHAGTPCGQEYREILGFPNLSTFREENGPLIVYVDYTEGISSSDIRQRIVSAEFEKPTFTITKTS